ncbi:MAG: hypothetical protein AAF610_02470 [Pseudomonadota bacterium]
MLHSYKTAQLSGFLLFLAAAASAAAVLSSRDVRELVGGPVDPERVWTVQSGGFSARGDVWTTARIGTFSDGSAVAEFAWKETASVIVFDQKAVNSTQDIARFRRRDFVDEFDGAVCTQRRWLRADSLEHRSEVVCFSVADGPADVMVSLSIDDGSRHIELYAEHRATDERDDALTLLRNFGKDVQLHATEKTS